MKKPKEVSDRTAKNWFEGSLSRRGPLTLLAVVSALESPETLPQLIASTKDLINSPELADPKSAPGHFAILIEALVWRFEGLVRAGALDEVLPRLTALPILYSPRNGKGASEWEMAKQLFEDKNVGKGASTVHRGSESVVARRVEFGIVAAECARLVRLAGYEFAELADLRCKASEFWVQKICRNPKAEVTRVIWYRCGTILLKWPEWLDDCKDLPARRTDAPEQYRRAADGLLTEFFAIPGNTFAETLTGVRSDDRNYSGAVAETKRRILNAIDRL